MAFIEQSLRWRRGNRAAVTWLAALLAIQLAALVVFWPADRKSVV